VIALALLHPAYANLASYLGDYLVSMCLIVAALLVFDRIALRSAE
jgi:hypothetical protein